MSYTYTAGLQIIVDDELTNLDETPTVSAFNFANGNSISGAAIANVTTGVYRLSVTSALLTDVLFIFEPHVDDEDKIGERALMHEKRDQVIDNLSSGVSLVDDAITAAKITSNAITAAKIADDAITAAKIASNAITAAKIASNAITSAKIAGYAISNTKLADNTITHQKIASSAILNSKIGSNALDASKFQDNTFTADKIADNAITGSKLDASAISAIQAGLALQTTLAGIAADYARRTGDYAAAGDQMDLVNAPNPTAVAAIQAGLALAATLEAFMGAGWVDETLVLIKSLIDDIIQHTGTDLPAYLVGLQSWLATEVIGFVQSGIIQQIRGNSWEIEIESLTLDPNLIQFAITKPLVRSAILDKIPPFNPADPDSTAVLFIDTDTGLLRLNGKQAIDPALGDLAYVGTTLTITLAAEVTAQLPPGVYNYGIQSINAGGIVSEPYMGRFTILEDVVRATA